VTTPQQDHAPVHVPSERRDLFQALVLALGMLAAVSLLGYATINLIRLSDIGPDAFVPKDLTRVRPSAFGPLQLVFILAFAFSLLPVTVAFTVRRFADNPTGLILGGSLMVLGLIIEIMNNLPILGYHVYPEPLAPLPREVQLHLTQSAAVRYLAFDVAGFCLLYAALVLYAAVYWRTNRTLGWLVLASLITFSASAPFLWIHGPTAMLLMAISIYCLVPFPAWFGRMAA
jgi:hypothetical protein